MSAKGQTRKPRCDGLCRASRRAGQRSDGRNPGRSLPRSGRRSRDEMQLPITYNREARGKSGHNHLLKRFFVCAILQGCRHAVRAISKSLYPATITATTAAMAAITAAGVAIQVNMRCLLARSIVRSSTNSSCSLAKPYRSRRRCVASSFSKRSMRSSDAAIASRCSPSGTRQG